MHGNLDKHPDIPDILASLDKAADMHSRNQNIAAGLIMSGTVLIYAGLAVAGLEQLRLKHAK